MVRHAADWPWSSYKATAGKEEAPDWLTTESILAAFAKRKSTAQTKYQEFVAQGHGQPSPWEHLKSQVFLGTESFVTELQTKIKADKDLSEIPKSQRRPMPQPIDDYVKRSTHRNEAIISAYRSGGYSMKELGEYFGLHYSRVSRIVSHEKAKSKTLSHPFRNSSGAMEVAARAKVPRCCGTVSGSPAHFGLSYAVNDTASVSCRRRPAHSLP
jgi:putative transposase